MILVHITQPFMFPLDLVRISHFLLPFWARIKRIVTPKKSHFTIFTTQSFVQSLNVFVMVHLYCLDHVCKVSEWCLVGCFHREFRISTPPFALPLVACHNSHLASHFPNISSCQSFSKHLILLRLQQVNLQLQILFSPLDYDMFRKCAFSVAVKPISRYTINVFEKKIDKFLFG